jgi:hypothetical protein
MVGLGFGQDATVVPRSVVALVALGAAAIGSAATSTAAQTAPSCAPGDPPVELSGLAAATAAKTYLDLPFEVADGTTRIEMTYDWTDPDSVLDLGLWDPDGVGPADGFRGWSGSRGGRVTDGQAPVFVQPDEAARGYVPGPIEPGTWNVDLGLAALGPEGTEWTVTVVCTDPAVGPDFDARPVDPDHVANSEPGVYYGDFHMHGYHSNANAPTWDEVVSRAEGEGLDIVFATDYVTGQHWDELGPVQEAHPDVLVWPGREIITYFGHANALGETPSVLDFRHGAPGVSLADIQRATVEDGALFQVNHPTIFPEAQFGSLCRGCEFTLDDVIDWDLVTTYEVLNSYIDAALGSTTENPFVQTAIDEWEALLLAGHRLTAVSGTDSKGVEPDEANREHAGYGSSATAVFADELSRAAITDALQHGRAYIRTRGADEGPEVDVVATTPDGDSGGLGDALGGDSVSVLVTVTGGVGHTIELTVDGERVGAPVAVDADPFSTTFAVDRLPTSGPLGTFVRVDTRDPVGIRSTIGNPIFLVDAASTTTTSTATTAPPATVETEDTTDDGSGSVLPWVIGGAVAAAALAVGALVLRRRNP